MICANCHGTLPTTMNHRNGKIEITMPSTTYTVAAGGYVPQDNQLTTTGMGTCSGTSCHTTGSPVFGTASNCRNCHGYPPVTTSADIDNKHVAGATPVNHIGTLAASDTKAEFVSVHGGCQICHGTESTTDATGSTHSAHANYNVATQHGTGSLNMNGPVGTGTGYDSTTRGCAAACHASTAPYRMTASNKTLVYGNYGTGGNCVTCHAIAQGTRSAVSGEFGLAWGHKKAGRTAVTPSDCIVCHLEGNFTSQGISSTYHQNGNVDLRDPDGAGETPITNISGGAFTFTKFAISFAAGSRTSTGHTSNTDVANVITQKFCLGCHDVNGASNTTARTRNAANTATTGTQYMPFEGVNLGAPYTVLNGAAAVGGVVNVESQMAVANSSAHPVVGPRSKAYPTTARLVAPYNGFTRTAGTKSNGVVMNCFDCHNETLTIASRVTNRTIASHGGTLTIPGTLYNAAVGGNPVSSPTFCLNCHIGGYVSTGHSSGSAISTTASTGDMTATRFGPCASCHFSSVVKPARPLQASDVHGFNGMASTGNAWAWGNANGMRPISLMRNVARWPSTSPRPNSNPSLTGTGANCDGNMSSNSGGISCSDNMSTYSPGGVY